MVAGGGHVKACAAASQVAGHLLGQTGGDERHHLDLIPLLDLDLVKEANLRLPGLQLRPQGVYQLTEGVHRVVSPGQAHRAATPEQAAGCLQRGVPGTE